MLGMEACAGASWGAAAHSPTSLSVHSISVCARLFPRMLLSRGAARQQVRLRIDRACGGALLEPDWTRPDESVEYELHVAFVGAEPDWERPSGTRK